MNDQKITVKLGWKKAKVDTRYLKYDIPLTSIVLPDKCNLRNKIKTRV